MKISELLDSIRKLDLVLPEFQREYVWKKDQAKKLMASLVKDYPVGGLLVWKTDTPPELKNIDNLPEKLGTIQVLLDGQQRLTTLHMLITGEIPAYYTKEEIENDPRDLYVNLRTLNFQYYQPSKMKNDPFWKRVFDCFEVKGNIKPLKIAQEAAIEGEDQMDLAQILMENLTAIRNIKEITLPVQLVPCSANLDEAIDIFDRVNSQGTKLTDAELALTHVTGKWPSARREIKKTITVCSTKNFHFGLTFMTRALTTMVTKRALFETIHERPREDVEKGWNQLKKILDYILTILPQKAFVHSTDDLNTTNVIIPLIAYLSLNNNKFPNEKTLNHATHWLYAALMWARYTAQTDQRLEADVQHVVRESEPWESLRNNIIDQRGRLEVKDADFEGRGPQHPLYKLSYILTKAHGAVDWFNGLPLGNTHGNTYGVHSHHIFPSSLLYKNGWDPDKYPHRQAVNEIANRAFLTATSNISLSNTPPEDYFPGIEDAYPGALSAQFIPMDPSLWKLDRYTDFLAARREIIARKMNEYMSSLISEPEVTHLRPITELIKLGESYVLEFKSTFQWDIIQGHQSTALRISSLRTVAAFMNSQGGTLAIGVEDDGTICGLERDIAVTHGSKDKFEQLLATQLAERIGASNTPYCRMRIEEVEDKLVCVVDVERSSEPVFLKTDKGKEFFVRVGNTSRSLDHEETHKYIEGQW